MNAVLVPRVHGERCTRYRFRYSECARCAESCPHNALRLSEDGVGIDAGACRHCGICVSACPTAAFESGAWSPSNLVRAAKGAKAFTVACTPSGVPGDLPVACLGAVDAATVLFLVARGVKLTLSGLGHCEQCAHGKKAGAELASVSAAVEHVRQAIGTESWGSITFIAGQGKGVDRLGAGRRQFFRRLVAGGAAGLMAAEGHSVEIPAKAVRAAPHHRPFSSELIGATLAAHRIETHPALPIGRVEPSGNCTGCELCERVCPTGALRTSETDGVWRLMFQGNCVACGVCVEACQPGALRMAGDVAKGDEGVELHTLSRTRCQGCGRVHIGAGIESRCPVCADDDQNFAAIFG